MNRRKHLSALALAASLGLTACGGDDTARPGTGSTTSEHGGTHDSGDSAQDNDADVAFLSGMVPHHDQAVEMSEILLRSDPPAEVAAIASQILDAQVPEIEQMNAMLRDLGESTDPAAHGGHGGSHGGMMSEQELAELEAATGTEAARLYLTAMIEHHQGAVDASDTQIAEGSYAPAIALAKEIRTAQLAETATMEEMVSSL